MAEIKGTINTLIENGFVRDFLDYLERSFKQEIGKEVCVAFMETTMPDTYKGFFAQTNDQIIHKTQNQIEAVQFSCHICPGHIDGTNFAIIKGFEFVCAPWSELQFVYDHLLSGFKKLNNDQEKAAEIVRL